jgi:hypothetical protein
MKIIPHALSCTGFFGQLDIMPLREGLGSLLAKKEDYFSFNMHPEHESRIRCCWRVMTESEAIEQDDLAKQFFFL